MARKKAEMSDKDILTKIEQKVKRSVGFSDSKLSKERERVIRYYNSELPEKANNGSSSYISTDVYDSVEAMKSQLLETFSGNQDTLISFPPQGEDDVISSRVATEYCSYVVYRENEGYNIWSHVIHDALMARVGIVKVFWEESHEDTDEEFEGLSYDDVQGLAAQDDISDLEAEADEMGAFSGWLTRRRDTSQVVITPIPSEEFGISKQATSIKSADLTYHRCLKMKAELREMGYPDAKVDSVTDDGDVSDNERQARHWMQENSLINDDDPLQDDLEKVWLYEAYCRLNLGKGLKLYKFVFANNTLFDKQEVYCSPFKAFTPLPIPHVFLGNNFAGRVIPTQNARTVLTRAILDHTATTTNPRWTVLQGGLLNPKEMLDNRKGGLVNIKRPDAVKALEQANLNPFVFQTLEMLKSNKEESTGISALSQGLNKEAISTQNSQGLVGDLVSLSQQRQKIVARNFAEFLIEVYLEVYRLVLANEKKEKIIEISGEHAPVSVTAWRERSTCKASVNLGYGDREKETQKFQNTHQLLKQTAGRLYTEENQYEVIIDGLKSAGFKEHSRYISDPKKMPPAEPDPLAVKELEIKEMTAKAQLLTAQSLNKKVDNTAAFDAMRAEMAEITTQLKGMVDAREQDRKDAEVANRIEISNREMDLAENPPPEAETRSIISPA